MKTMKPTLFLISVMFGCLLSSNVAYGQGCLDNFNLVPVNTSIKVGSIIVERKGKITNLFTREWLIAQTGDSTILGTDTVKLTPCTQNITNDINKGIDVSTELALVDLTIAIKAGRTVATKAEMVIEKGFMESLTNGEAAFKACLRKLPEEQLRDILEAINQGDKSNFVTQLAYVEKGRYEITVNKTPYKAEIGVQAVGDTVVDISATSTKNNHSSGSYNSTLVGYSSMKPKKFVNSVIKEKVNTKSWYHSINSPFTPASEFNKTRKTINNISLISELGLAAAGTGFLLYAANDYRKYDNARIQIERDIFYKDYRWKHCAGVWLLAGAGAILVGNLLCDTIHACITPAPVPDNQGRLQAGVVMSIHFNI
jgi:hypothetical protein